MARIRLGGVANSSELLFISFRGAGTRLGVLKLTHDMRVYSVCVQDLPGALDDAQVAEGLGLHNIKSRDWAIFKTSAIKGEGLMEGLDWLSNMLTNRGKR
jgi:hypothetical protein